MYKLKLFNLSFGCFQVSADMLGSSLSGKNKEIDRRWKALSEEEQENFNQEALQLQEMM